MAEQPLDGQPLDGDPDDERHRGQGRPVPRSAAAPAAAKPQRGQPGELRDIIPPHLRTWQGIRKALRWHYRRGRHHALYHAVRSPKRLVLTVGWALVGVARIAFAQLGWWWVSEQAYLRHEAAATNDPQKWLSLHKHVREVRLVRGCVLRRRGPRPGARRRGGDLVPAGAVAAHRPRGRAGAGVDRAGPRTSRS